MVDLIIGQANNWSIPTYKAELPLLEEFIRFMHIRYLMLSAKFYLMRACGWTFIPLSLFQISCRSSSRYINALWFTLIFYKVHMFKPMFIFSGWKLTVSDSIEQTGSAAWSISSLYIMLSSHTSTTACGKA